MLQTCRKFDGEEAASFSWEEGLYRKITVEEAMGRLNAYTNTNVAFFCIMNSSTRNHIK
jgi:hypothetical protein